MLSVALSDVEMRGRSKSAWDYGPLFREGTRSLIEILKEILEAGWSVM